MARPILDAKSLYKRFVATQSKHKMASSDNTVTGTVVETYTQPAAEKNKKKNSAINFCVIYTSVHRAQVCINI